MSTADAMYRLKNKKYNFKLQTLPEIQHVKKVLLYMRMNLKLF